MYEDAYCSCTCITLHFAQASATHGIGGDKSPLEIVHMRYDILSIAGECFSVYLLHLRQDTCRNSLYMKYITSPRANEI
jgi:hypothetical protein